MGEILDRLSPSWRVDLDRADSTASLHGLLRAAAARLTAKRQGCAFTPAEREAATAKAAQDIFVESATTAYFGKPQFDVAAGEAWLPVWNLSDAEKLRGVPLKVTLSFGDSGIEQMLAIN